MTDTTSVKKFYDMLLRYSQELHPEGRKKIEADLWEEYGATISPMVVDMSGFTRLSEAYGVVHYLSMVRRMQLTTQPIVESYGGKILKFEADNAFAYFESPGNAIQAAISLNLALKSANLLTPEELDIRISCGIDHGRCLLPHSSDYFGSPVNRASKLGEDTAGPGQILVTAEAMELVSEDQGIRSEPVEVEFGGKARKAYQINY